MFDSLPRHQKLRHVSQRHLEELPRFGRARLERDAVVVFGPQGTDGMIEGGEGRRAVDDIGTIWAEGLLLKLLPVEEGVYGMQILKIC